jgi:hypothetical protein
LVSRLTLFSGFGWGTLLMPAFALFFPLEVAIAATGDEEGDDENGSTHCGRHAHAGRGGVGDRAYLRQFIERSADILSA